MPYLDELLRRQSLYLLEPNRISRRLLEWLKQISSSSFFVDLLNAVRVSIVADYPRKQVKIMSNVNEVPKITDVYPLSESTNFLTPLGN